MVVIINGTILFKFASLQNSSTASTKNAPNKSVKLMEENRVALNRSTM